METKKEWEKEFDKEFVRSDGLMNKYSTDIRGEVITMAQGIKSFIASAIVQARLEEREEETAYWRCAISHLTNVQRISVIATYQKLREIQQKLSAQSSPE